MFIDVLFFVAVVLIFAPMIYNMVTSRGQTIFTSKATGV